MDSVWSDSPIRSTAFDTLGRTDYVKKLVDLIQSVQTCEESVVFGLTGPWGSGKSSMLQLIDEEFKHRNSGLLISRFTPWATSDTDGLLGDFYAALIQKLPVRKTKHLRKKLGTLMEIAAPTAKLIPYAGDATALAIDKGAKHLKNLPAWDKVFEDASSELKKLNTPVLIVADDIDRLQRTELLELLKVIRLIGRFPGVHFLIAYDAATVSETIALSDSLEDSGIGRKFMEKIVQYPLTVPPLSPTQIFNRLEDGLSQVIVNPNALETVKRRLVKLRTPLLSLLSTPRAIDRFLAQVNHSVIMLDPEEVLTEDLVVLALIKTTFPSLYIQLPKFKDQVTSSSERARQIHPGGNSTKQISLEKFAAWIPIEDKDSAYVLLQDLFPVLDDPTRSLGIDPAHKGIRNPHYFDRYFALGIPNYDVSDVQVAEALHKALTGDRTPLEVLLTKGTQDQITQAIAKAELQTSHLTFNKDILLLLEIIIPLTPSLPINSPSYFIPPRMLITWTTRLLEQLEPDTNPTSILRVLRMSTSYRNQIEILRSFSLHTHERTWLKSTLEFVAKVASNQVIENLKLGDDAPESFEVNDILSILQTWNQVGMLREEIRHKITQGLFTEADVSARCVGYARGDYGGGLEMRLATFNRKLFAELIPEDAQISLSTSTNIVDELDLSWDNRRLYAARALAEN